MTTVHFRMSWVPEHNVFALIFQLLEAEGSSPACWNLTAGSFKDLLKSAESQLAITDGMYKVGEHRHYSLKFVDRLNNDCEINFHDSDSQTFAQIVEYLRKVYDSWKIYHDKE